MTADELLVSTTDRILSQTCTFEAVERAEREGWAAAVWHALSEAGLPWVGIPEESGGVGGTLEDAMAILRSAGAHAVPAPLAETGAIGGWMLARAGLEVGSGPLTVAPGGPRDNVRLEGTRLYGTAHDVPWGRQAEKAVLLVAAGSGCRVVAVDPGEAVIDSGTNLAGEPRDRIYFDATPCLDSAPVDLAPSDLRERGALTRVVLTAGALQRVCDITVQYTAERIQFGRPVARFQLVQAHLVHLAQDAALVSIAADAAVRAASSESGSGSGSFEIAASRCLAHSASASAVRAAHQAHGAMGMTREYPLHHLTRRIWSWCHEYGKIHYWQTEVARHALLAGPDNLYPLVSDPTGTIDHG